MWNFCVQVLLGISKCQLDERHARHFDNHKTNIVERKSAIAKNPIKNGVKSIGISGVSILL